MERRKPEQTPRTPDEEIVKQQEVRVLELAIQCGFSIHKGEGSLSERNQGQYQLIEWDHNQIVLGARFDASLDQIEGYLSQHPSRKRALPSLT